ncbi:MAG: hypothetical protein ACJA09_002011 [Alcanivorax sp.]|jgi:uncharacterized protein GlcG (DUF336 family)
MAGLPLSKGITIRVMEVKTVCHHIYARTVIFALTVTTLEAAAVGSAPSLVTQKSVNLATAKLMIKGCEAYAQEHSLAPLAMAVYDRAGNLTLFINQDNAMQATTGFAMAKARTAAVSGVATGALGDLDYENHERPIGIANMPGLTVAQGGLPISTEDGEHLGGVGVSGASSTEDEACSRAAIDAVKGSLK